MLVLGASTSSVDGAFVIKNGSLVDADEVAKYSAEQHYSLAADAYQQCHWDEAARQFRIVATNFPNSEVGPDSWFYLAISYYHLEEYDFSNDAFSNYLKCHTNPEFFEDSIEYKFYIANLFRSGAKCRFFGTKHLPKWASGRDHAIDIYEEVIAAVPCHELAAWSLFYKAQMFREDKLFCQSIDIYQLLIRRFPKHELAPESYMAISKIFIVQSGYEKHNPDLLAFAQINLRRFQNDFPRDERICIVEQDVQQLKEIYATSLYETGQFYEHTNHDLASVIYYQKAVDDFPDTCIAVKCRQRLNVLSRCIPTIQRDKVEEFYNDSGFNEDLDDVNL
jgi:outer membrane protein assembly factor BamD (BamD/ComL family)